MTLSVGDKLAKARKEKVDPMMGDAEKWYVLEGEVQRVFEVLRFDYVYGSPTGKPRFVVLVEEVE